MDVDRPVWPNFFIAGVPKTGTTSLYYFLRQHPQIYLSPLKEPCFFAADDLIKARFHEEVLQNLAKYHPAPEAFLGDPTKMVGGWGIVTEEELYLKLFRDVRDEIAIGEASVPYFYLPSAAGAIAARLPHARLVFMLRDPAERAFSQYLQYLAHARNEPLQSFRKRFLAAADAQNSLSWWLDSGRYATNLGRFLERFPQAHVQVHLFEDYQADPHGTLRDIFAFLGVDPEFRVDVSRRYNESSVSRFPLLHSLHRRVFGTILTRHLPDLLRPMMRAIYYRREAANRLDPDDRQLVIDYFRDEIERTAKLIRRDLSAWLR